MPTNLLIESNWNRKQAPKHDKLLQLQTTGCELNLFLAEPKPEMATLFVLIYSSMLDGVRF